MSGTDWLRDLVKRHRKTATGGYIPAPKPDDPPLVTSGCQGIGYLMPQPAPRNGLVYSNPTIQIEGGEPVPVTNLVFETDHAEAPTTDGIDALRYAIRAVATRTPSYRSNCGCWPQYRYCYCDLRKPSAQ